MLSGQRFEDFARIGADWFWETDREDRFIYFSAAASQLGFNLTDYIGRTRREIAVAEPENLTRLAALEEIMRARRPFRDVVYQLGPGTGPRRWCSIGADPVFDAAGAFEGYRGVARDVTALVEMQADLMLKSRALDAILAAIPDGVQVIDKSGTTLAINDQLYDILALPNRKGFTDSDSTFQSMLEMARRGEYGPGDPEVIARERISAMFRTIAEEKSVTYQRQLKIGRWFEARLREIDGGGMLSLYRDITEDKKREAELERQATLLSTILTNMDGGIAVYDKDLRLVAWNERFPDMVGIDPAVVRYGAHARELLTSQARLGELGESGLRDPEAEAEGRLWTFRSDKPHTSERKRPNGRVIELHRNPTPAGGSVTIYIDVTARREAEWALQELNATLEKRVLERTAALDEAERFQRSLVASMPGMVYSCQRDAGGGWRGNFASEGSRDLVGVAPEDLVSGAVVYVKLIHPDDRLKMWQRWREEAEAGRSFELEYRVRHRDGSLRWILDRAHGIRDKAGNVTRVEGLMMDVTARKHAETELARVRDNLVDALESLDHNLILYDGQDRLVLFTPHLYEQYPEAHRYFVPGQSFEQIFTNAVEAGAIAVPPGRAKQDFIAERVARHRAADGATTERHLTDGRVLHISERPSPSGGIVAIGRDVTERLKIEQQLREAQRMEAIGQLTGGLAHDLNNYLSVIMGNLDLLAERPSVDPETPKLIEGAMAGAQRGAELTRSLLAFSRRQPLDPRVLDVGERIAAVARLLKRTIGEKITLDVRMAPDLWPVEIDGAQLDSAIVNLANNARDAMPDGGRLTIGIRNMTRGGTAAPVGDCVMIEVTDTGTGMDAATLAQAFEPFFSTKGPGHGTGLGLSMVHGFVHQSGGAIDLSSTPGTGTTVRVFLPRALAPVAPEATPRGGGLARGTESILLVEDNEDVRGVVVEQMRSLGYRVTETGSGDAALSLLEAHAADFDLVMSDVVMPGKVDGMTLAGIVQERWPKLRILLTTGFAGDTEESEPSEFVMLRKPYRKVELAGVLRATLDGETVRATAVTA
ncbi:MAG: PAS-domain containing protein [Alphaproteobacteria bacterium]|nr:PAS-domain containing protein [Alphaproteobacteria bacterium]